MSEAEDSYTLRLVDEVTAPASRIMSVIDGIERAMGSAAKSIGEGISGYFKDAAAGAEKIFNEKLAQPFEAGGKKVIAGVSEAGESLKGLGPILEDAGGPITMAIATIGEITLGATVAMASLAAATTAFAVNAADEHRNQVFKMIAFTGSEEAAEKLVDGIDEASKAMGVGKDVANDWASKIEMAGFKGRDLAVVMGAASDAVAMRGGDAGAGSAVIGLFDRMERTHKVNNRVMQMTKEIGLTPAALTSAVAARMHSSLAAAQAAIKAGHVNYKVMEQSILDAIQNQTGEKELGSFGQKFGMGSIAVQSQHLKDSVMGIFETVDTKPFAEALANISKLFDTTSGTGKGFVGIINEVVKATAGVVTWLTSNPQGLSTTFTKITSVAETAWSMFIKISEAIESTLGPQLELGGKMLDQMFSGPTDTSTIDALVGIGKAVGVVVGALAILAIGVIGVIQQITHAVGYVVGAVQEFYNAGKHIVEGLWNGISSSWREMIEKFHGLAAELPASVKKVLGIASPSKVMMELGVHTGEGFQQGLMQVPVQHTMSEMIAPPSPHFSALQHASSSKSSGGGASSPSITLVLHAPSGTGSDPEDYMQAANQIVIPEMISAFEQMRLEAGG